MLSLLFYLCVAGGVAVTTRAAQKTDRKLLLLVPVLILTLVAGLRGFSVGVDTETYGKALAKCYSSGFSFLTRDYLFYYWGVLLLHIWYNISFVFFVFAGMTYSLVFLRLWDFRRTADLGMASLLFVLYYMGGTMNGTRQYIAIAIIFYGTRYLRQERYLCYFFFLMFAAMIHLSAIIAVIFVVPYIGWRESYRLMQFLCLAGVAAGSIPLAVIFVKSYSGYAASARGVNFGLMWIVRLLMAVGTYVVCRNGVSSAGTESERFVDDSPFWFLFAICLLGFLIGMASMFVEFASRMGYYFRIFEIVFFGMVFQSELIGKNLKVILGLSLTVLGGYYLWAYHGIIPYAAVFQ